MGCAESSSRGTAAATQPQKRRAARKKGMGKARGKQHSTGGVEGLGSISNSKPSETDWMDDQNRKMSKQSYLSSHSSDRKLSKQSYLGSHSSGGVTATVVDTTLVTSTAEGQGRAVFSNPLAFGHRHAKSRHVSGRRASWQSSDARRMSGAAPDDARTSSGVTGSVGPQFSSQGVEHDERNRQSVSQRNGSSTGSSKSSEECYLATVKPQGSGTASSCLASSSRGSLPAAAYDREFLRRMRFAGINSNLGNRKLRRIRGWIDVSDTGDDLLDPEDLEGQTVRESSRHFALQASLLRDEASALPGASMSSSYTNPSEASPVEGSGPVAPYRTGGLRVRNLVPRPENDSAPRPSISQIAMGFTSEGGFTSMLSTRDSMRDRAREVL